MAKKIIIYGEVQGVGFRYSMLTAAQKIGITGWVRNNRNGTVEALVQGAPSQVDEILEWAQNGPSTSSVDRIEVFDQNDDPHLIQFTISQTI